MFVKWLGRAFHVSDTLAAQVFKGLASLSPVSRRPSACAWLARADQKEGRGVWREGYSFKLPTRGLHGIYPCRAAQRRVALDSAPGASYRVKPAGVYN